MSDARIIKPSQFANAPARIQPFYNYDPTNKNVVILPVIRIERHEDARVRQPRKR